MSIVSIILQSVVLLLLTRAGTKSSRRSRFEDYQNGESQRGTANSGQRDANRGQKRSCGHALSIRFTKSDRNSDESSSYKPMNSQNMHYKGK